MARGKRDNQALDALKKVPLLAGLTDKQLKLLAGQAKEVAFSTEKVICKEGEKGTGLHVILDGEVKVQIRGRTRRKMGPGAFFGEVALLDGGPRSATVIAETDGKLLSIPFWNFKSVIKEYPAIALKMLEEVASRLRNADSSLQR